MRTSPRAVLISARRAASRGMRRVRNDEFSTIAVTSEANGARGKHFDNRIHRPYIHSIFHEIFWYR